jgi:alpha-L-fucosidase 2
MEKDRTRLDFPYPAAAVHDGIPLGNGLLGVLLGGDGGEVRVVLHRADYWDHRGGKQLLDGVTFAAAFPLMRSHDEPALAALFRHEYGPSEPAAPNRLPVGRFLLRAAEGRPFRSAVLDMGNGEAEVRGAGVSVRAVVVRTDPVCAVIVSQDAAFTVEPRPADAPDIAKFFHDCGYPPAVCFDEGDFSGWTQSRPDGEPTLCAACLRRGRELFISCVYGRDGGEARANARRLLDGAGKKGYAPLADATARWWKDHWSAVPSLDLPDADLTLLYRLGMYKLGGMSSPDAVPAGLQGPWGEGDRGPPGQGDYHFNINVQECYWPAYAGNRLEWLRPLFEMLWDWRPTMRENAKRFLGIEDGLLLFMATDDRCQRIYDSWLAVLDFSCAAWMAHMMWQYYRFTMDEGFLRDRAYPFMKGALRVYEAILEDDGKAWHLPMGVSAEFYFGNRWGRDASFQVAVIHALTRGLVEASRVLGADEADRARWADIDRRLPPASAADVGLGEEILIWDGQHLDQSHRHHSHLAGIYPFDTLAYGPEEAQAKLVSNSMKRLTRMGMGAWGGWCLPWASILWSRMGQGHMARFCLDVVRRFFLRPGHAGTHDAVHPGFTVYDYRPSIMQLDGTMGTATAVLEMLLQTRSGVLHVFPAPAPDWPEASFRGIRAEGAFLVDASWKGGRTVQVKVRSVAGCTLKLANPFAPLKAILHREGGPTETLSGDMLEIPTGKGETIVLTVEERGEDDAAT